RQVGAAEWRAAQRTHHAAQLAGRELLVEGDLDLGGAARRQRADRLIGLESRGADADGGRARRPIADLALAASLPGRRVRLRRAADGDFDPGAGHAHATPADLAAEARRFRLRRLDLFWIPLVDQRLLLFGLAAAKHEVNAGHDAEARLDRNQGGHGV